MIIFRTRAGPKGGGSLSYLGKVLEHPRAARFLKVGSLSILEVVLRLKFAVDKGALNIEAKNFNI